MGHLDVLLPLALLLSNTASSFVAHHPLPLSRPRKLAPELNSTSGCAGCKLCSTVQDKMGCNASDYATAAQVPAEPACKAAGQLFISGMGPPAHKTASLARILSRAPSKTYKAPVAILQQPSPSLGDSRAGVQSAEAGPSGPASGAAAAQAGKQQAASWILHQVVCTFHLPCHACRLTVCPAKLLSTLYGTEDVQGRHLHCKTSA